MRFSPKPKCARCLGRDDGCLCSLVRPLTTQTRFVVFRHAHEKGKQSNTARIAALALSNLEIREYGSKDGPPLMTDLSPSNTWLLFPESEAGSLPASAPQTLVVLDGSWGQTRRMIQRVPLLRQLPRISLVPAPQRKSLRRAPPGGMSTIEAIARVLELFEAKEAALSLDALHEAMIDRVIRSRGYL
jgi:DTW domain-containing protein